MLEYIRTARKFRPIYNFGHDLATVISPLAVRLRAHHAGDPNCPAGAGDIFNDDRLTECDLHAFA